MNIKDFVIDSVQRDMILALVEAGRNVLLTGPTGAGKTTFCYAVADSLGLKPVVINLGSTQDARSTLLGNHSLQDGNTSFDESDFIRAIQTPNTLVVLDEISRASSDAMNILFPVLDGRREITVEENDGDSRVIKIDPSVRFISTANIGTEYSAARKVDRALLDRFMLFTLPYINASQLLGILKHRYPGASQDGMARMKALTDIYDHAGRMQAKSKLRNRISPRTVIEASVLTEKFSLYDILNNVVYPMFAGGNSIANDRTAMKEFVDSKIRNI